MAKLLKCPRCNTKLDVTDLSAGSTVRCTDCGAMVRIPTGSTGVNPAVSAPIAAPAKQRETKSRPKRQTSLFRKMSNVQGPGEKKPGQLRTEGYSRGAMGAKKSNTPMIVGISVGALALVGVIASNEAG